MKHKQHIKQAIAGILACAVIGSNALPAASQFPALFPLAVTASAASCCSLNASTGVLTLSGNVDWSTVRSYANNAKVKSVVCKSGTVFPADSYGLFGDFRATTMDLSNANVRNVTNMRAMFSGCTQLTSINLNNFVTGSCTDMAAMFKNCYKLTSLDLRSFSTALVKDMSYMFDDCSNLQSIKLNSFNTASCKNMSNMFRDCSKLVTLRTWSWNTSNVTNMSGMFMGCKALRNFYVEFTNTSHVTDMSNMFKMCEALTFLDLTDFNTSSVTNTISMFERCTALKTIYATNSFTTANVPNLKSLSMFSNCPKLVGGNGTHVTDTYKTYARIDKPGQKGYFTQG